MLILGITPEAVSGIDSINFGLYIFTHGDIKPS